MSDTPVLTLRDRILAADDIPEQLVTIDEWGVELLVRGLTAAARSAMIGRATEEAQATGATLNLATIYPDLVIGCTYDPATRQPVFGPGDRDQLMGKSGSATEKIAIIAMNLSGFTDQARKALGKDSSTTEESDGSSSS